MREAVIVSYARTGLTKAARGGFNNTSNMAMLGHAVEHAVKRSGVAPAEVEDVVAGCVVETGIRAQIAFERSEAKRYQAAGKLAMVKACERAIAELTAKL